MDLVVANNRHRDEGDLHVIDKEGLLKGQLPELEVDVPGKGSVRVRGLSRAEYLRMGVIGQKDIEQAEVFMLSVALVDPSLSEAEVKEWRSGSTAGEIDPVTNAINDLSGLNQTALKQAVETFRDDTGAPA